VILSLRGRLETRWFLAAAVGLPWTVLLAVLIRPGSKSAATVAASAAATVALMSLLGTVWECAYHACQQLRWDRDWPSALVLASALVEVGPLWWTAGRLPGVPRANAAAFLVLIGTAWLVMWLFAQGPMRVLFLRWRFNGGRLSCAR
jgi:hypothetical protein